MSRIVAIDYGTKRTGIAVSDPLQMIAGGLTTVSTHKLYDFLTDYMAKEDVERVVFGLPKQTNGEDSTNKKNIDQFVNRLRKHYPALPIDYYDERYTSVIAHQAILDSGARKKTRQNKNLVDMVSATIILRDYLEAKKMRDTLPIA